MGRVLLFVAAVFFFFAAVGVAIIPNPTAWGLVILALGLAVGGYWPNWKQGQPNG